MFKFGGTPWTLFISGPHPTVMYFLPHWGRTMCYLSLGVWTNIFSVFLFVCFVFACIYLFLPCI
jgi:hypothetical protein